MPYEAPPGVQWLRIGLSIACRGTCDDVVRAAAVIRTSGHPEVEEWIDCPVRNPAPASEASAFFENLAIEREVQNR